MKPIFHVVQTENFTAVESEISDKMKGIKLLNALLGKKSSDSIPGDGQGQAGQGSEQPDGDVGVPVPCRGVRLDGR